MIFFNYLHFKIVIHCFTFIWGQYSLLGIGRNSSPLYEGEIVYHNSEMWRIKKGRTNSIRIRTKMDVREKCQENMDYVR